MRDDMAQVVTERHRAGGGVKTPKGERRRHQRMNVEDLPKREKIRQKWQTIAALKSFTDVLGPMYRYLLSKVGQSWDEVWSEICLNLPATNTNTSHVRHHVLDFVETKTVMVDGQVCWGDGWGYGLPITGRAGRYEWQMYVHPETGIICKVKEEPASKKVKVEKFIDVPGCPDQKYHKINGIWYILTLYTCRWMRDRFHDSPLFHDLLCKKRISGREMFTLYGKFAYCTEKRQINKREILKAGLREVA